MGGEGQKMRASTNKISINNVMLALEILTLTLRRKAIIINHLYQRYEVSLYTADQASSFSSGTPAVCLWKCIGIEVINF